MLEHVVGPNPINILLLLGDEEGPEPFHCIVFEAPAELVPIGHVQRPEALLVVHAELPLVVAPVGCPQIEAPVGCGFTRVLGVLVVEHSEAVEGVAFPAARVADFGVGVVEHAVSVEFALAVELALVLCAVGEV